MPYSVPVFGGAKLFCGGNDWIFCGREQAEGWNREWSKKDYGWRGGIRKSQWEAGRGRGQWLSPVSLSPSLPSSELILKSVTSQTLSTPLSSAIVFPASPPLPATATCLPSWAPLQMDVVWWSQDTKAASHHFSSNLSIGAASALRNVSLLCLQPHSGGLHHTPSGLSTSGSPESWKGQNS